MKKYFIVTLCFFILQLRSFGHSQTDSLVPLGICLENYTYPFPVKYISLSIGHEEIKMAYMDVSPAQANGKVVLLLHGKNFSGVYWENTARYLADRGYRVIIPDQIGFGKSFKPVNIQYSFQWLATNTRKLLDTIQVQNVIVLGHSMGGMLATRFALMFPDRVTKLILEDPIGLEDWKLKVPYLTVDQNEQSELKQDYQALKKYESENYFHNTWSPSYDKMLDILGGWKLSPEYGQVARNAALTSDMIFTQPVCYEFSQIKAPTLLIIGLLDRTAIGKNLVSDSIRQTMGNYPRLGRLVKEKIPHCTLIELPGLGHVPHMENFDEFIKPVMSFLNE